MTTCFRIYLLPHLPDGESMNNPLVDRYASKAMVELWSDQRKFTTWRQLWLALAQAQADVGLQDEDGNPRIAPEALEDMTAHLGDIDFTKAAEYEKRFRHDVVAHIHTYGDAAPKARDIIHLGATSCYVTDNTDLILMGVGLDLLRSAVVGTLMSLLTLARRYRSVPTVAYTHFQPATLTTVGKRFCLWAYDLVQDETVLKTLRNTMPCLGAKGATGTQASFLELFQHNPEHVLMMDDIVARKMGFTTSFPVTGQTYPRKVDVAVLNALAGIAISAHKFATDLRLLQHEHELFEPFETEQVGSSAMAYKRNPMRSERLCSLARYLMNLVGNAQQTAANQWLERTLDDSANRRLVIPQAFLVADAILRLYGNIIRGVQINETVIEAHVAREVPFLMTETVLMKTVKRGKDRQEVHAVIRKHSLRAAQEVQRGQPNNLVAYLMSDGLFHADDLTPGAPESYTGLAAQQVEMFVEATLKAVPQGMARAPQELTV